MKKIKTVVGAILRAAFLFAPAFASAWYFWGKVQAIVNILAALGILALWLLLITLISVALAVAKENPDAEIRHRRNKNDDDPL